VTDDEQYAFFGPMNHSSDFGLYVLWGPTPEIGVHQPAGTDLADGSATTDFGSVDTGSSSAATTYTVTNSGTANLTGLAVTKDGTDAGMFDVGALGATNLTPGASTTFTVTFAPTSAGAKTAAIHIASNDSDENPFDIELTGTGMAGPMPPTEFTATASGTNRIDLTWVDNATNETDYVVDRSLDSNAWAQVILTSANVTNCSDIILTTNTLYYYRVAASNAAGLSAYAYASERTWSAYEAWQHLHFTVDELTNTVISGDDGDKDGDHFPNWMEFLAGTDPTNGASLLRITQCAPSQSGGDYVVTWQSVTGKAYTLQSATNLVSPELFTNVATGIQATPTLNVYTNSVDGALLRFYRIKLD